MNGERGCLCGTHYYCMAGGVIVWFGGVIVGVVGGDEEMVC